MRIPATALAIVLFALSADAATKPLMLRNSHPLMLAAPTPRIESIPTGRAYAALGLGYSSTFLMERSAHFDAFIDTETAIAELEIGLPLWSGGALVVEIPVSGHQSGVLDGPLGSYHDALGTPDYGRSTRPDNSFLLTFSRDGNQLIDGMAGAFGLSDPRFIFWQSLYESDTSAIALMLMLEPPIGEPSHGMGNGSWDTGAALAYEGRLSESFGAFVQAGYVMPGDFESGAQVVKLNDIPYAGLGLTYDLSSKTALIAQAMAQGSAWQTGIRELDSGSVLGALGVRRVFGDDSEAEVYLAEDINTAGAPDFMIGMALRRGF